MRRTETIFDSETEHQLFDELEGRWSPRLRLIPQLPLSKLVEPEVSDGLSSWERGFFYMTNVDYTFCWPDGQPWLSVEFDGIGHGFSRSGEYVPGRNCDPGRAQKLAKKIRICEAAGYPLLVVSFDEIEDLDEVGEPLTMLDGIVGQLLARVRMRELLEEKFSGEAEWLAQLGPDERDSVTSDWVLDAEMDAEYEEDLLTQAVAMQGNRCYELGVFVSDTSCKPWLYAPPLPDATWPPRVESIEARIEAMRCAARVGSHFEVETPRGKVSRTVWVRNVGEAQGISPGMIADKFAQYWVSKDVQRLMADSPAFPVPSSG
jgi:hypothetical protein